MSVAAGRLPEDVYTNTLPSWRAALRRKCVAVVERESKVISVDSKGVPDRDSGIGG